MTGRYRAVDTGQRRVLKGRALPLAYFDPKPKLPNLDSARRLRAALEVFRRAEMSGHPMPGIAIEIADAAEAFLSFYCTETDRRDNQ